MDKQLKKILEDLKIEYQLFEHPPVHTVEEAEPYWSNIEATHCKNLFLRNGKGSKHYLIVTEHSKKLSIKKLEEILNEKLSFASPERLKKYLNLEPGSVSPFGLINDISKNVKLLVDSDLQQAEKLGFHPNTNMATLVITLSAFQKFINWSANEFIFCKL